MTTPTPTGPAQEPSKLLKAARDALRSYEYGNSSPDLAKEIADAIDAFTKEPKANFGTAGPALLRACKLLAVWIEQENSDDPELERLTLQTVLEHVNAAIDKAERPPATAQGEGK